MSVFSPYLKLVLGLIWQWMAINNDLGISVSVVCVGKGQSIKGVRLPLPINVSAFMSINTP